MIHMGSKQQTTLAYYVVATDTICKHCGETHGYATRGCGVLVVYTRRRTAEQIADALSGDPLPIAEVPSLAHYVLETR